MLDKILDFIVEYVFRFVVIEQYLNIINKTKMLYNRKFTHSVYLNLASVTLNKLRGKNG